MPVTAIFESGVDRVNLLKINVEGAEYDILDKLIETGYIKNVDNIQVQFHNFVPNAEDRRQKIQTELAISLDFTLSILYNEIVNSL
jgi:hypothetical protein